MWYLPNSSGIVSTRVSTSLAWNRFGLEAHFGLEMVIPSARNLVAMGSK